MSSDKSSVFQNKPPDVDDANRTLRANTKPSRRPAAHAFGDAEIQNFIGAELKALYDSILNEPVSDSLLALINELDQKKSIKP